jgi:hypothetical protein
MPTVYGYLRDYRRWDGSPGHALTAQKAMVTEIIRRLETENGKRQRYFGGRKYLVESGIGHWPVLFEAIQWVREDVRLGALLVIPTLDGVQFNLSFLELLADPECDGVPICVQSAWRRVRRLGKGTNYEHRFRQDFWMLGHGEQWSNFSEMVDRVRERNRRLPKAIREGLKQAAARGNPTGAGSPGAHRFTAAEQSKGGRTTAAKRRDSANVPYRHIVHDICRLRSEGQSFGQIVNWLAAKQVTKPDGSAIGIMLARRIYARELRFRQMRRTLLEAAKSHH